MVSFESGSVEVKFTHNSAHVTLTRKNHFQLFRVANSENKVFGQGKVIILAIKAYMVE